MPTIGDDDRQYWNPMGLFVERLLNYRRRKGGSPLLSAAFAVLVVLLAGVALAVIAAVVS